MWPLSLGFVASLLTFAQEVTLRTVTKEVAVPFVVFDEKGFTQGCPSKEALSVLENGRTMSIRGVQLVNGEPIALGIVLSLDTLGISSRDDTRTALAMVRDWLNDGDGCIAVNATGFHSWDEEHRGFGKIRQSDIALGRLGCLPLLQDLSLIHIWFVRHSAKVIAVQQPGDRGEGGSVFKQ